MEFPTNLKYTEDHEWIRVEDDNVAYIGITDHAQSELGEIVYVEVDSEEDTLEKGEVFGSIEAVKTVSDLYMPVSGTVLKLNPALDDNPELVNESPYKEGWIIKIKLGNPEQLEDLLDAKAYQAEIGN